MTEILAHWTTFATALICAIGSAAIGLNEILHGPDVPTFRQSPVPVRLAMQGWCFALAYRAADLAFSWWHGHPQPIGDSAVIAGLAMMACQLALLWDTLNKRLPARTWARINRILHLASCGRRGKSLAELALRGVAAIGPGETLAGARLAAIQRPDSPALQVFEGGRERRS